LEFLYEIYPDGWLVAYAEDRMVGIVASFDFCEFIYIGFVGNNFNLRHFSQDNSNHDTVTHNNIRHLSKRECGIYAAEIMKILSWWYICY